MPHKIAVSLAPHDTESCLTTLQTVAPMISMAEIRLDLMETFDLPQLARHAPCPLIITCRPPREGGRFPGTEEQRLAILAQAMALDCAYVDVEWDCVQELAARRGTSATRLIASRHWSDGMPTSFDEPYRQLAQHADVVKLVGLAREPRDLLPVLALLHEATTPIIALAMGDVGRPIRLLAPCFASCLLTYGAATSAGITAPGQLTVAEMIEQYHLDAVGPHTRIHLHLCAEPGTAPATIQQNQSARPGDDLFLGLVVPPTQLRELAAGLRQYLPRLTLTADEQLATGLADAALD